MSTFPLPDVPNWFMELSAQGQEDAMRFIHEHDRRGAELEQLKDAGAEAVDAFAERERELNGRVAELTAERDRFHEMLVAERAAAQSRFDEGCAVQGNRDQAELASLRLDVATEKAAHAVTIRQVAAACIEDIRAAWTGSCDDDRWAIQLIEARFGLAPSVSPPPHPRLQFIDRLGSLPGPQVVR